MKRAIGGSLNFCRKRADVQELIRAEVKELAPHGAPKGNQNARKANAASSAESAAPSENKGNNITFDSERGTAADYTVARLNRDRPDLAQQVKAGEISANAAAIQAGFRERTP